MTKTQCINEIKRAIEHAKENGFTVVVASDPEGNNWHSINPLYILYDDTNNDYIALGVWEKKDEEEIFNSFNN